MSHNAERGSLLAVAGLFAVNGALVGGVGATLPAMRVRLGVDSAGLAVLLVSLAAAAVVSMQIGGRLADSHGPRNVSLPASAFLVAGGSYPWPSRRPCRPPRLQPRWPDLEMGPWMSR